MQNRGAIILFAVVFSVVCIYELSFTWITRNIEKDASQYATNYVNTDAVKKIIDKKAKNDAFKAIALRDSIKSKTENAYLDSLGTTEVYNLLLHSFTYNDCKKQELNLGLDLKGGMNVVLEISVVDVLRSLSGYTDDADFNKAIKKAQELQKSEQKDFVTLFGEAFKIVKPDGRLAPYFRVGELHSKIDKDASNDDVLKVIKKEAQDAIDNAYNVLSKRIDQFGVTQPNVQRMPATGRILVELPGIKNPERARKMLQTTARLEFWPTYDVQDINPFLIKANERIKAMLTEKKNSFTDLEAADSSNVTADAAADTTAKVADAKTGKESQLEKAFDKNAKGTKNIKEDNSAAKQRKENPLFSLIRQSQMSGRGPVVGSVSVKNISDTSKVNTYLNNPMVRAVLPNDVKFLWSKTNKQEKSIQLIAIKLNSRDHRAPLDGSVITNARVDYGQMGNTPEILMQMNTDGAAIWKRLTKQYKDHSIAVVLDEIVYSYPTVQNEIDNGSSQITGNFTKEEADDLAKILMSGKLPAPARIVEEAIVGPSLGQEAISAGLTSFMIALLVVVVYMAFYYNRAGLVADVALLANVFFIMGVLASLKATLTLPGLAGIVLTIATSVDANVIIFERIREELATGKGMRLAIVDGYKHAYTAIIDSNVTTLITGIILFVFGSGPIKGFATTLIIGILTSLFAAIFITRLIFQFIQDKNKEVSFSNKLTAGAFKKVNIDFVGKRKIFYAISGIVILIGIGSMFYRGFDYGVDFVGGRTYLVRFDKEVNTVQVQDGLKKVFVDDKGIQMIPEVKTFGSKDQVRITTKFLFESNDKDADDRVKSTLVEGLNKAGFTSYQVLSSQKVGPTIADDIRKHAFLAVLVSLVIIFIYILVRFKKWQYSLGAIVALFHDVLIILSLYSIFYGFVPFAMEIDQAFIAAILTIMGYSMMDTVIIFDRIRENVSLHKKNDLDFNINHALNSTISRTINTSLITILVLTVIFLLGGDSIRGFIFAMIIGIIVGTYSSLYVASPVVFDTLKKDYIKE